MGALPKDLPLTFIHGQNSWVPRHAESELRAVRDDSYLDVRVIDGAGHEIYAEDQFNIILKEVCETGRSRVLG